jgi:uncharacterized protein (DUF2267 family)
MSSATGLAAFDKILQATNLWLDDIMEDTGADRPTAWRALGAVLRTLRDRLPLGLAAHLGAELPILVRGIYYERWEPSSQEPRPWRTSDEFLAEIAGKLGQARLNVTEAARAVFHVIDHYVDPNRADNVREALPEAVRSLWSTAPLPAE